MITVQKKQETIKKLSQAINKILKETDPNIQEPKEQIAGIVIMRFPINHKETTNVYGTILGRICFTHLLEYLEQVRIETELRELADAS